MKTPWTKGPWRLRTHSSLPAFVEAPKAAGMAYALDVCGEDYTGYGEDEQRAINMELIALAPEMAGAILDKEFSSNDDTMRIIALKLKAICDKYVV